jgi:hypothetical protein
MKAGILLLAAGVAILALVVWLNKPPSPYASLPPKERKEMEEAYAQSQADWNSEFGKGARAVCSHRLGIDIPANTALDLLEKYGVDKSMEWAKCVVDTMYPDPDPWRHPQKSN